MLPFNNKRPVESFIVALPATTLKTAGTLNLATGAVDLLNGQIGVASASYFGTIQPDNFLSTAATIDTAPQIVLYQGTPDSAAPHLSSYKYPLSPRPYEVSMPISGRNNNVQVTKQAYREGRNAIWTVGAPIASATSINTYADTDYAIRVAFTGTRVEEFFSDQQAVGLTATVHTPAGAAFLSIANPLDWLVQHLTYELNLNSAGLLKASPRTAHSPFVAIAVGSTTGVLISSITAGTTVPVMNTTTGVKSVYFTQEMVNALTTAAAVSPFTRIALVDLTTAGTTPAAEGIMIIGLDTQTAYIDYIPQLKTNVRVGLTAGFDYGTFSQITSTPDEGQGYGRQLDLFYRATQGQRKYNLRHTSDLVNPEYPSPVNVNEKYTTYVIHHGTSYQPDTFNVIYSPLKEVILIPNADTALQTDLETLLNTWLLSGDNQPIITV